MKCKAFELSDGSVAVVSFPKKIHRDKWADPNETDEQFIARAWEKTKARLGVDPSVVIEIEEDQLPPRYDGDGVCLERQWRIKNGRVEVDGTVRNIHREIFDKQQAMKAILDKQNPNGSDAVEYSKHKRDVNNLNKELEAIK